MSDTGPSVLWLAHLNQKADDLETWYAASGAPVLPSLARYITLGIIVQFLTEIDNILPVGSVCPVFHPCDFLHQIAFSFIGKAPLG